MLSWASQKFMYSTAFLNGGKIDGNESKKTSFLLMLRNKEVAENTPYLINTTKSNLKKMQTINATERILVKVSLRPAK